MQNGQVKRGESFPAEFTISIPEDANPGKYPTRIHVQGQATQVPNAINIPPMASQTFIITVRGDPWAPSNDRNQDYENHKPAISDLDIPDWVKDTIYYSMITDTMNSELEDFMEFLIVNNIIEKSEATKVLGILDEFDNYGYMHTSSFPDNVQDVYNAGYAAGYLSRYGNVVHTQHVVSDEPLEVPAAFVDRSRDPYHYVNRYESEEAYKQWFDENYPEYDSIYHAVGLENSPEKPPVPAPFVDATKDPQYYVDRYQSEKAYKAWFDENYPEYYSIYHAVGLVDPSDEVGLSAFIRSADQSKDPQDHEPQNNAENMLAKYPAAVAFAQKHPVFEQALYDLGMDYEFEMLADDGVSSLRINQAKSTGDAYATYNCELPDGTPYAAEGSDIADRIPGLCLEFNDGKEVHNSAITVNTDKSFYNYRHYA